MMITTMITIIMRILLLLLLIIILLLAESWPRSRRQPCWRRPGPDREVLIYLFVTLSSCCFISYFFFACIYAFFVMEVSVPGPDRRVSLAPASREGPRRVWVTGRKPDTAH